MNISVSVIIRRGVNAIAKAEGKIPQFEIFNQTGKRVMYVECTEVVYSDNELKEMQEAGYKIKKKGKSYRPK